MTKNQPTASSAPAAASHEGAHARNAGSSTRHGSPAYGSSALSPATTAGTPIHTPAMSAAGHTDVLHGSFELPEPLQPIGTPSHAPRPPRVTVESVPTSPISRGVPNKEGEPLELRLPSPARKPINEPLVQRRTNVKDAHLQHGRVRPEPCKHCEPTNPNVILAEKWIEPDLSEVETAHNDGVRCPGCQRPLSERIIEYMIRKGYQLLKPDGVRTKYALGLPGPLLHKTESNAAKFKLHNASKKALNWTPPPGLDGRSGGPWMSTTLFEDIGSKLPGSNYEMYKCPYPHCVEGKVTLDDVKLDEVKKKDLIVQCNNVGCPGRVIVKHSPTTGKQRIAIDPNDPEVAAMRKYWFHPDDWKQ